MYEIHKVKVRVLTYTALPTVLPHKTAEQIAKDANKQIIKEQIKKMSLQDSSKPDIIHKINEIVDFINKLKSTL
jgi:hypothetical protein